VVYCPRTGGTPPMSQCELAARASTLDVSNGRGPSGDDQTKSQEQRFSSHLDVLKTLSARRLVVERLCALLRFSKSKGGTLRQPLRPQGGEDRRHFRGIRKSEGQHGGSTAWISFGDPCRRIL
jgi:hypothetical protein